MLAVRMVLGALFFLAVTAWGGGLVVLAIAARVIDEALKKRRTEGRQIVRRLRGVFQRMELVLLGVLWATSVAHLLLETFFPAAYPGSWGTGDAIALGVLVIPTIAAAYSTFYLTPAIRKRETRLGGYADKDEQVKVRKSIAALLAQAQLLTWLKAGAVALLVIAAVAAALAGRPAAASTTQPTTAPAASAPASQP